MSVRHLWQVCRGIFDRAGIRGSHVHPHSFRHTVIQMLFMTGSSFDVAGASMDVAARTTIAKWIGHASPFITSSVYGRLAQRDVEAQLVNAPFLQPTNAADASAWHDLAAYLREPYHFTDVPRVDPQRSVVATHRWKQELIQRAQEETTRLLAMRQNG